MGKEFQKLWRHEDYWAIWLGMIVILLCVGFFWAGSSLKPWAVTPGTWSDLGQLGADLARHWPAFVSIFLGFGLVFAISMRIMGRNLVEFLSGYTILFIGSLGIFYLAGWSVFKKMDLGAPLLALIVGLMKFWGGMKANDATMGRGAPVRGFVPSTIKALTELVTHDRFGSCTDQAPRKLSHLMAFYGFIALFIGFSLSFPPFSL